MSKIIKASRIKGEYKLSDIKVEESNDKEHMENEHRYDNIPNQNQEEEISEEIKQARERAEQIIAEAEKKAEEIKENAAEEAANIKEEAREEGFDQGYQEGKEKGVSEGKKEGYDSGIQQLSESLNTLDQVIEETKGELKDEIKQLPVKVINLSTQIASRVVNAEIDLNPELINNIIADILEEIGAAHEDIMIKVSPEVVDYIEQARVDSHLGEQDLEIIDDTNLNPGDCIIETEFGGKDATLSNKFDLIEKKLYQGAGYNEES